VAGTGREHLLWVLAELCAELGFEAADAAPEEARLARSSIPRCGDDEEEEELVARLRQGLVRLGLAALAPGHNEEEPGLRTALDGTELVMRAEIAAGRAAEIGTYLPAFTMMVAMPGLGRERAIALSRRAEQLLEQGPERAPQADERD
jgi:hypothetical protein